MKKKGILTDKEKEYIKNMDKAKNPQRKKYIRDKARKLDEIIPAFLYDLELLKKFFENEDPEQVDYSEEKKKAIVMSAKDGCSELFRISSDWLTYDEIRKVLIEEIRKILPRNIEEITEEVCKPLINYLEKFMRTREKFLAPQFLRKVELLWDKVELSREIEEIKPQITHPEAIRIFEKLENPSLQELKKMSKKSIESEVYDVIPKKELDRRSERETILNIIDSEPKMEILKIIVREGEVTERNLTRLNVGKEKIPLEEFWRTESVDNFENLDKDSLGVGYKGHKGNIKRHCKRLEDEGILNKRTEEVETRGKNKEITWWSLSEKGKKFEPAILNYNSPFWRFGAK